MHKTAIIFLFISSSICLGVQKNRLIGTVLLSTQYICFGWELRKIISYTLGAWIILRTGGQTWFNYFIPPTFVYTMYLAHHGVSCKGSINDIIAILLKISILVRTKFATCMVAKAKWCSTRYLFLWKLPVCIVSWYHTIKWHTQLIVISTNDEIAMRWVRHLIMFCLRFWEAT